MIENLRVVVTNSRGSRRQVMLHGLGNLNVICGKNGSGKSTLLQAISDTVSKAENQFACLKNDETLAKRLAAGVTRNAASILGTQAFRGGQMKDNTSSFSRVLQDEIATIFRSRLPADRPIMVAPLPPMELGTAIQKRLEIEFPFLPADAWQQIAESVWPQLFEIPAIPTHLIPAKRKLDSSGAPEYDSSPKPSGEKVLQHLFELRSKPFDSPAFQAFRAAQRLFSLLSGGVTYDVFLVSNNIISLRFKFPNSAGWIDSNETGLGYRDLLLISYWVSREDWLFLLIEEPENHLHSDILRKLADHLSLLDRQTFVATHSRELIETTAPRTLYQTWFDDGLQVAEQTDQAAMLLELGCPLTQLVSSGLLILTEGHTDKFAIEVFLRKKGVSSTTSIAFWALGGDGMHHVDLTHMRARFRPIVLLDLDPKSDTARKRFIHHCEKLGVPIFHLERYAIENYFSPAAYRKVFPAAADRIPDLLDHQKSIEVQIGMSPKGHVRDLAQNTDLSYIKGTKLETLLDYVTKNLSEMDQAVKTNHPDSIS